MRHSLPFLLFLLHVFHLCGQQAQPVVLNNASLEDIPKHARPPIGWFDCGAPGMTPVDTQPSGFFGVEKRPHHGQSYVGMVTRDNHTWEKIGQLLPLRLEQGQGYALTVYLAQSRFYISYSMTTTLEVNYVAPTRLRIWGGYNNCDCRALLAESQPINHTDWVPYQFRFVADQSYTHLTLEAFYASGTSSDKKNGHLLIDDLSPIYLLNEDQTAIDTLPTLSVEYKKETSLSSFVEDTGPKLRPNNAQLFWEQHAFLDEKGLAWTTNQYAWQLAQAVRHHPTSQLIITIDKPRFIFERLQEELTAMLTQAGLKANADFVIKPWKRRYRKQDWLWPVENTGVTMQVKEF
jgi:hypothetical protein